MYLVKYNILIDMNSIIYIVQHSGYFALEEFNFLDMTPSGQHLFEKNVSTELYSNLISSIDC